MIDKKDEALKLALETLKDYKRSDDDRVSIAMGILQDALAEQPAQDDPCIDGSCSCCWSHLDGEPHKQQEPVAWRTRNAAPPGGYVVFQQYPQAVADLGGEIEPLYTSPPASKPWVELTPAEVHDIWCFNHTPQEVCDAVSAKLREKNQ